MPDDPPVDDPPPSSRDLLVQRLRAWGTLVTAVAGLATALLRPQDQSVTKAAYQQCTEGIEKLNQGLAQEHENVATLRGYIAAQEGQSLLTVGPINFASAVDAGAPVIAPSAPVRPPPPVRPPAARNPPRSPVAAQGDVSVAAGSATASSLPAPAAALAADLPPEPPAPKAFHPADFDSVLRSVR